MFENDYIMRMILQYLRFLRQALQQKHKDPREAAMDIEQQIGQAVNIDSSLLFSLSPDSMVAMLELSGYDQRLAEYMVRAMALNASLLEQAGFINQADLRRQQLEALILSFRLEIEAAELTVEALEAFTESQIKEYGE
ncbi:MAG: hypothetical protein FWD45_05500 [Coriobacteriia bacterium]|nr:hypothetical protein [Coriobacteriia bacterium]